VSAQSRDSERGLTLIEMVVAMSLLAIVTTLVTVLVVTLSQTFARQESEQDSSNRAALAMQHVSRVIRSGTEITQASSWQQAPVFSVAEPRTVTLQSYVGVESTAEGPARVVLTIDTARGELTETRFAPRKSGGLWVYDTTPTSRRVLAHDVTEASAFAFVRANGTLLPDRALAEAERREIAAVRVDLVVQTHGGSDAQPAALRTEISLRNLDLTRTGTTP